jgi:phosphoserine phosphatase RsbU/P
MTAHPALEFHVSPGRPRVLVAEDQADVIAALHLLLKRNGYEAEFASSPDDALEALRERNFDVALLDLNYSRDTTSGKEGLELVSRAQAIDTTLAVVVMTAWGSISLAVEAMHRGACDFVQKPWDNAQLLRVLQQQVERSHSMRQKRLSEELEQQDAARIQRALMPHEITAPAGMTIAASSQSAHIVGGDYYDVIQLDANRTGVCIADVMGKGVGAALLMSNLQAAVRMLAPEIRDPAAFCGRANQAVSANNVPGKFITFFYCVIDSEHRRISFTNAGHNWPVLAHADGTFDRLSTDDMVLGTTPKWNYHQRELELRSGDRLLLFTDGITEACGADGTEFGEHNLLQVLRDHVSLSAADLRDALLEAARSHCRGVWTDDATLIVIAVD